jgi:adenylate cyclase
MANYRTTVILKTDIVDSTPRLAGLTQAEMSLQRKQHKQFISETAAKNHGAFFQEEGDAYWIQFPSVTNACFAAMEMHQSVRSQQAGRGEKQRLAIRAVITVGDILHEGTDSMGMTMSLTARMEKITPPDEIYLSQAAWLVLNKAEVQTSLVGEFPMKGFADPERVYKVDQKSKLRVLKDQFIVFTDIRGWTRFTQTSDVEDVEQVLIQYDDLMNRVCDSHNGAIRNVSGDQYFMTFSETENFSTAMDRLTSSWKSEFQHVPLGLSIAVHKGDLNIVRSYLFGNDIHTTVFLGQLNSVLSPNKESIAVVVSGKVQEKVIGTEWATRFQFCDPSKITDLRLRSIVEEHGAYWLSLEDDASQ